MATAPLRPPASRMLRACAVSACAATLALTLAAGPARGYADRAGTDVVMDAPWRSMRDHVPVLFFLPQFEHGRRVLCIRIRECVDGVPVGPTVFVDAASGPDTLAGATIVDPLGRTRGGLEAGEPVASFWHYVVRLPHAVLAHHATPDVHELRAEVEWRRPGVFGGRRFTSARTLRVLVDPTPLPSLAPGDRYLDVHVHTIAEQSRSSLLGADSPHKAFGGPLVMLLESAYAIGLVDTPLRADGWDDYAGRIAITDHNIFYSAPPYDAGTPPRYGPTAATDGHAGEAAWYRAHLGALAGEEITLRRGSNQDGRIAPNLGAHLLAYGTRHFEGPWHGGLFLTSRLENPNTLESVLAGVRAAGPGGFLYAAHPNLAGFVWPPEYFAQGIGLPPHDSWSGPAVDSARSDFVFKGSEVWNIKMDQVARDMGRLPASSAFEAMNPFPGGPAAQRFRPNAWDGELTQSLDTYFGQLGRGLRHAFREAPDETFVRKLYMSAGSDAHGDFDYSDEVSATLVPYSGALHNNAFARVRTYTLVHARPADDRSAVAALADGNTVLTDGPLFEYQLDADGRHDPGAGAARWHDAASRWEDADGRIGGSGAFDGGGTMLVPEPGGDVWIRSRWLRSATPGAGPLTRFRFDRITAAGRDTFAVPAGPEGADDARVLPVPVDRLAALVATARDRGRDERCIANPVWVAPVRIDVAVDSAASAGRAAATLPARALRVTFAFPFSMSAGPGTRAFLRPLGADGTSCDPEIALEPDPGWQPGEGGACSRYTVTNLAPVPVTSGDWDARSHAAVPGARSFVVYLVRPADLHGNVLDDVGRAFTRP